MVARVEELEGKRVYSSTAWTSARWPRCSSTRTRRNGGDERTRDELYAEAKRLGVEGPAKMYKRELERAVARIRDEKFDSPADVSQAIGRLS